MNAEAPPEWGKTGFKDWLQTRHGRRFRILDPHPDDFDIEDIAHALANQCRFTGRTTKFYSVAEHSVRVARLAEKHAHARLHAEWPNVFTVEEITYAALMHDASDAYIMDMPRPVKYLPEFKAYRDVEHNLMHDIAEVFRFRFPKPEIVHWADNVLMASEARDLYPFVIDDWHLKYAPLLDHEIRPWSPAKAKREFLKMFYRVNALGIRKPSLFRELVELIRETRDFAAWAYSRG